VIAATTNLPISNPVSLDWTMLVQILIVIIGFFAIRTLKQLDKSQTDLWAEMKTHRESINTISDKLSKIVGEHTVMMRKGGHNENE